MARRRSPGTGHRSAQSGPKEALRGCDRQLFEKSRMMPQAKQALRERSGGHFRQGAITARWRLIGMKRFPVMKQLVRQEDGTRAGGEKGPVGVRIEAPVEGGNRRSIQPDPWR